MSALNHLIDGISTRINANLMACGFDASRFIGGLTETEKILKYWASYEPAAGVPLNLDFHESILSGSFFLGKCRVDKSVVYKSDVRGDELKLKGDMISPSDDMKADDDEQITISNSFLFKTLIHNNSHNPETPEEFFIKNTLAGHYAIIHGATLEGCFIGPFSTIDRTALHACIVGEYSYIRSNEHYHRRLSKGTILIENEDYSFQYCFPEDVLNEYISLDELYRPKGILCRFMEHFEPVMNKEEEPDEETHVINRFAVIRGKNEIFDDVVVPERVLIDSVKISTGVRIQESAILIQSEISDDTIIKHGGKVLNARLGKRVSVGMNSFLNGKTDGEIEIGNGSIIVPHTIIDPKESISIGPDRIVWGVIRSQEDVEKNSFLIEETGKQKEISMGEMSFTGKGPDVVAALRNNAAAEIAGPVDSYCHDSENTNVLVLQPYRTGPKTGIYPSIKIER